ncbi:MAG: NAD(P)-binding protein, partial [Wenzhouxiangella sp.]
TNSQGAVMEADFIIVGAGSAGSVVACRLAEAGASVLVVEAGEHTVEMVLMVGRDAVQAPPCPIDGRPQKRMALDEVEALVSQASS